MQSVAKTSSLVPPVPGTINRGRGYQLHYRNDHGNRDDRDTDRNHYFSEKK